MWVKTTFYCRLCLLLILRKIVYNIVLAQTHTSTQASTCRRLQPSLILQTLLEGSYSPLFSCTSRSIYQYVGCYLLKYSNLYLFSSCYQKGATTPLALVLADVLVCRRRPTKGYNLLFLPPGTMFHQFSDWIH